MLFGFRFSVYNAKMGWGGFEVCIVVGRKYEKNEKTENLIRCVKIFENKGKVNETCTHELDYNLYRWGLIR